MTGEQAATGNRRTTDSGSFAEEIKIARESSWKSFGARIRFYTPSFLGYSAGNAGRNTRAFPSISVTGRNCALKCKHCCGRLLNGMIPAESPRVLREIFQELHERNVAGCLVSGGCGPDGAVPLEPFIDAMTEAKRDFGLRMVVHTGILGENIGRKLGRIGIDAALIDVIGSEETLREIYGLKHGVEKYDNSLSVLEREGIPAVPHILVGLHYGTLRGEFDALKMVARHNPAAVIIIGLTPLRRTPMAHCSAASPSDVVSVIVEARKLMPGKPIALGCARPKGKIREETDVLAVEAGVNGIANPDPKAIELARNLSLDYSFSDLCCSQVHEDFGTKRTS